MQAIILAGGFGTRLQSVVSDRPKPMALVNNQPFLKILVDQLHQHDFEHIVISVGYMSDMIIDYFKDYTNISFCVEPEPLGTGGAVRLAYEQLNKNQPVLVVNGDTYCSVSVSNLILSSALMNRSYISVYNVGTNTRYSGVDFDKRNNDLTSITSTDSSYIYSGFSSILPEHILKLPLNTRCSFEQDIILPNISEFAVMVANGLFIDIGIPEDYSLANWIFNTDPEHTIEYSKLSDILIKHQFKSITDFKQLAWEHGVYLYKKTEYYQGESWNFKIYDQVNSSWFILKYLT